MEYVRYERVYDSNETPCDFDSVYSPIDHNKDTSTMPTEIEKDGKKYILAKEDGCVVRHIFPKQEIEKLNEENLIVEGRVTTEETSEELQEIKNIKNI